MLWRKAVVAVLVTGALTCSLPLWGQGRRAMGMGRHPAARPEKPAKSPKSSKTADRTAIDEFERMSAEQRQTALAKLPPERADKLRKQLKEYSKLTPEQQALAKEQLDTFRRLPPERQDAMRKAFNKFSHEPPERQQTMRQELNQLRGLSPADRQSRLASSEFKSRFTGSEQKIIAEMSDVLPE